LEIHAEHTSYQLNYIIVKKITKSGVFPQLIMESIAENDCKSSCPFEFTSNIFTTASKTIKTDKPLPFRSIIGGVEGSFIDTFGGELKWERYTVRLLTSRGADRGVRIAYGKNLTGLNYEIDISDVVTGVVAYYSSGDNYVESARRTRAHTYGFSHDIAVDATSNFNSVPTVSQLNTWADNYLSKQPAEPKISVDVDFILLGRNGNYQKLEHVNLCDTVEIIYPPLNLKMSAKVVETVYNVLEDRYNKVTVSNAKRKITDTIYALMKKR
jgi:phage minor structural protein